MQLINEFLHYRLKAVCDRSIPLLLGTPVSAMPTWKSLDVPNWESASAKRSAFSLLMVASNLSLFVSPATTAEQHIGMGCSTEAEIGSGLDFALNVSSRPTARKISAPNRISRGDLSVIQNSSSTSYALFAEVTLVTHTLLMRIEFTVISVTTLFFETTHAPAGTALCPTILNSDPVSTRPFCQCPLILSEWMYTGGALPCGPNVYDE